MFTSSFTKLAPLGFAVALLFLTVDGTESRYETWLQHYSPKPCENCDGSGKICWSYDTLQYSGVKCECKGTGTNKYAAVLREMENLDKLREHLEGKIEELNPLIKKLDAGAQCDSSELEALQDLYFKLNQAKEDYGRFQQELIKINKGFVSYLLTSHSTCDGTCSDEGTEEDGTCSGCDKPWRMNIQYNQARRLAEATQGTETLEMNPEDLSNAGDRNALVRDLEDLSKERNALIEQRNDLSSELQDVRRRITEIEEQREHLKQKFAVEMDSQARLLRSRELMDELRQLTQDYQVRCEKLASKEFREKKDLKHERDCLEEWYNQRKEKLAFLESTINNQAPGPSRPHPVCPEPLMAE